MANVFRWTGHFPERTRVLFRFLAERAARLGQGYSANREDSAIMALTYFPYRSSAKLTIRSISLG